MARKKNPTRSQLARPPEPAGLMPGDTLISCERSFSIIKLQMNKINKLLMSYYPQMSEDMRIRLATELVGIGNHAKVMSKRTIGNRNITRLKKPNCQVKINIYRRKNGSGRVLQWGE